MDNTKAIEAIKEIRKREEYHYQRTVFCRQHNLVLDILFHQQMESELRQLASKLESLFDCGYVTINKD